MTPARSALSGTSAPTADKRHAATKISLVLADVDGTLVTPGKVLTPRAAAAVKAIHDAGIAFAITSGRPPRGMAMLVEPLALHSPIAGFNGGIFVNPDLTIIEQHVLPPDVAVRALDIILHHGMDVWFYSDSDWLVRDLGAPHVAREQSTVKFGPTVVENLQEGSKPRCEDRRRERRSRPGRTLRKGCASRPRRGRVGGAFATLLPRHHPSRRQQRVCRHYAIEAPVGADPPRSRRSATCRTTC